MSVGRSYPWRRPPTGPVQPQEKGRGAGDETIGEPEAGGAVSPAYSDEEVALLFGNLTLQEVEAAVGRMAQTLLKLGLIKSVAGGRPGCVHYVRTQRTIADTRGWAARRWHRLRGKPGRLATDIASGVRQASGRPRRGGRKAFARQKDSHTSTTGALTPFAGSWTSVQSGRTGVATGGAVHNSAPLADASGALGVVGIGFQAFDSVDQLNGYLDECERRLACALEAVLYYPEFCKRLECPDHPDRRIQEGFRRCLKGLQDRGVWDKAVKRAWKNCKRATCREMGPTPVSGVLGLVGAGLKFAGHGSMATVAPELLLPAQAVGGVALLPSVIASVLDIVHGHSEWRLHTQKWKLSRKQVENLMNEVLSDPTLLHPASDDARLLRQAVMSAVDQHHANKRQARWERWFSGVRLGKGLGNLTVTVPLGLAALIVGAACPPLAIGVAVAGGVFGLGFLASATAKMGTRHRAKTKLRRQRRASDALAATGGSPSPATSRITVPKGQLLPGERFAGNATVDVDAASNPFAGVDAFGALVGKMIWGGMSKLDDKVKAVILAFLESNSLSDKEVDNLLRILRGRSLARQASGLSDRDEAWGRIKDMRELFGGCFGLKESAPKLYDGVMLCAYHVARLVVLLESSQAASDPRVAEAVRKLKGHFEGRQLSIDEINETLGQLRATGVADVDVDAPLSPSQQQALGDLLFQTVPPSQFAESIGNLLAGIAGTPGLSASATTAQLEAFTQFVRKGRDAEGWDEGVQAVRQLLADADRRRVAHHFSQTKLRRAEEALADPAALRRLGLSDLSDERAKTLRRTLDDTWRKRFALKAGDHKHNLLVLRDAWPYAQHDQRAWEATPAGDYVQKRTMGSGVLVVRQEDIAAAAREPFKTVPIHTMPSMAAYQEERLGDGSSGVVAWLMRPAGSVQAAIPQSEPPGGPRRFVAILERASDSGEPMPITARRVCLEDADLDSIVRVSDGSVTELGLTCRVRDKAGHEQEARSLIVRCDGEAWQVMDLRSPDLPLYAGVKGQSLSTVLSLLAEQENLAPMAWLYHATPGVRTAPLQSGSASPQTPDVQERPPVQNRPVVASPAG